MEFLIEPLNYRKVQLDECNCCPTQDFDFNQYFKMNFKIPWKSSWFSEPSFEINHFAWLPPSFSISESLFQSMRHLNKMPEINGLFETDLPVFFIVISVIFNRAILPQGLRSSSYSWIILIALIWAWTFWPGVIPNLANDFRMMVARMGWPTSSFISTD